MFYYNLPLGDIEIYNIISYIFLTFNGYRQFFQKIIPKMLFLGCHIYAKIF